MGRAPTRADVSRRTLLRGGLGLVGGVGGAAALAGCGASEEPAAEGSTPSPSRSATASPGPHPSVAPVAAAAPAVVEVLARDAWGAAPPVAGGQAQVPARLTVHNSAYPLRANARAPRQVRALQRDHLSRRWPDVSYHWLVDAAGNAYQGRDPLLATSTPTPYDPDGHLTVCLLGMFDRQPLPDAQLEGAAAVLAWTAHEHGIATDTLAGHSDFTDTTPCPGRAVHRLLADGSLRARVEGILAAGEPRATLLGGASGRARVREIERVA